VTISFDCDFQEDITAFPQLLKMLSSYPFKTNFACIGNGSNAIRMNIAALFAAGHEILNHTYSHPNNEELQTFTRLMNFRSRNKRLKSSGVMRFVRTT